VDLKFASFYTDSSEISVKNPTFLIVINLTFHFVINITFKYNVKLANSLMRWLLLIIKSTNVSSGDRMFIWRRIKKTAAVPLSHSVYLLQDTEDNRVTSSYITRIIHERNGEVLQFFADASNKEQERKLNKLIAQEVIIEIKDFSKQCKNFIADVNQRISNKNFEVFELEELNDDLHQLDELRIKLIQKYKPDSNIILILSEETRKCKEKLNKYEEKIHQKNEE
jgi:hypothetical protein